MPDTAAFMDEGDTAKWFVDSNKITEDTVISKDSTAYLKIRDTCNVTITRDLEKTIVDCHIGEALPEEYYYIANNKVVDCFDGSATSFVAYSKLIVDNVEYIKIDYADMLRAFANGINSGMKLNGYLTEDIDTGSEWTSIGTGYDETLLVGFDGIFEGNGHKITLGITESGATIGRTLFGFTDTGAVIRNLITSGSITTNGKYAAGIVGLTFGDCLIENCGSNMSITYMPGGDATAGGMIGHAKYGVATVKNCYYAGSMQAGASGSTLSGQGGLVGWKGDGVTLNATNCLVTATFVSGSNNEVLSRNGGNFTNCYYVNNGLSGQGTSISSADCKT